MLLFTLWNNLKEDLEKFTFEAGTQFEDLDLIGSLADRIDAIPVLAEVGRRELWVSATDRRQKIA
jgi:hypothetical protein